MTRSEVNVLGFFFIPNLYFQSPSPSLSHPQAKRVAATVRTAERIGRRAANMFFIVDTA